MKKINRVHAGVLAAIFTILSSVLPQPLGDVGPNRAVAQSIFTDAYTLVRVSGELPYDIPDGADSTIDGPTSFSHIGTHVPGFSTAAELLGEGFANFGTLKAKVELSGPAARTGSTVASFNEIFTPAGGILGTADEITLYFSLGGTATIDVNRNDIPAGRAFNALAIISVTQFIHGEQFGTNVGRHVVDLSAYAPDTGLFTYVNAPPAGLIPITVPFVYGETFSLLTQLTAHAAADNDLINVTFSPYFENWGGGVIDRVVVDYFGTAELIAIVNETNPNLVLMGQSSTDYTPLVTDTIPTIPEPTTLNILAIGGMLLLIRHVTT